MHHQALTRLNCSTLRVAEPLLAQPWHNQELKVATLRKRGDAWHVQIRKQGYKALTRSFNSKADALSWAKQVESEMERGCFIARTEAERTTLGELFERYAREVTPHKRCARRERSHLRTLTAAFAPVALANLRSQDVTPIVTSALHKPARARRSSKN